jgi:hypothetical protein
MFQAGNERATWSNVPQQIDMAMGWDAAAISASICMQQTSSFQHDGIRQTFQTPSIVSL